MKPFIAALTVASLLGCTPRVGTGEPAPTVDAKPYRAASTTKAPPSPPVSPAPSPEAPSPEASWLEPLPPLTLTKLSAADHERARACLESHRVQASDVTSRELMAAATCLGAIPHPGHEIRLYKHLVEHFPDAPETENALRELGLRFEQIDARDPAITAYMVYLRRHPKQADARGLGQRAVCLALSLGDDLRAQQVLAELERLYGRRGFTRPEPEALERLCDVRPAERKGG